MVYPGISGLSISSSLSRLVYSLRSGHIVIKSSRDSLVIDRAPGVVISCSVGGDLRPTVVDGQEKPSVIRKSLVEGRG